MISRFPPVLADLRRALPGLALATGIALAAMALQRLPGVAVFSPMIVAILLGIVVANTVGVAGACAPGLAFAMRPILRSAIVLLGLRITPGDLASLGIGGVVAVATTLAATFLFTGWIGRRMGMRGETADLIAAGTAVCGASAVVAMNATVRGSREDVAHAVATVTLFGTLSMFLFPALGPFLALGAHGYGLWTGSAIHEIAQVIAAGFQGGPEAGEFATIAKLARVAMLAPLVIAVGFVRHRGKGAAERPPFPWFVVGFLVMVGFAGIVHPGPELRDVAGRVTTFLFTVALGAMGLLVDIRALLRDGWRPLALGAISWVFVSAVALLWVEVLARSTP